MGCHSMLLLVSLLLASSAALRCLQNTNSTRETEWSIQDCNTADNEISCLAQYRMHNGELLPSYFGCHATDIPCNASCMAKEGQNKDFGCCCSSDLCNIEPLKNTNYTDQFHDCCADVDDCDHSCINLDEQPQCYCDHGYTLSPDGESCIDLDECAHNNGGCEGTCHNEIGTGYHCSCPPNQLLTDKYYCRNFSGPVCYSQTCNSSDCPPTKLQPCEISYPEQQVHCQATYKKTKRHGFQPRLLSCFSGNFPCTQGGCTLRKMGMESIYYCCCDGQLCNGNITFPAI